MAWPWLVAADLGSARGEPCEVHHVTMIPMGSRVVDYAISKVEASRPDLVLVPLGSYVAAIRTVGERVRRRYGERAHRIFRRLEVRFEARTGNRAGVPGSANRWGRRLLRRVIGTEAYTTLDEVAAVYEELLRRLSQHEGLPVLVLAEPRWPAWVDRENAGANTIFDELCRRTRLVADRRRMLWADCEPLFALAANRDALYLSDGVHKSAHGARLQAQAVLAALREAGAGFPPEPGGDGSGT
ncbi:MAG: hypothetical protein C0506_14555 [Anaerolinea sp.]|nr:hypothetical protein [Anaerolinea sp.]